MKARIIYGKAAASLLLFVARPAWADNCPLGKELAARSMETFKTDQGKGLAGLIQTQKYCPEDPGIAYNLGLAYYRYKRPDLAYDTWKGLAEKQKNDHKLLANLGWLALELDRLSDAASWAEKAYKIKSDDANVAGLSLEVLFRQGKYEKALSFARNHSGDIPKEKLSRAAEYVAEEEWNVFRAGRREQAVQDMMKLASECPDVAEFQQAKDKMFAAMLDASADIPLPKPLPDRSQAAASEWPTR